MSDTDSFIDEVTEEVRRDRMFLMLRRYGWIGALAVVAIVGGAAYNEYSKSQATAQSQKLGDDIIAALAENDAEGRASTLSKVQAGTSGGAAVVEMLVATAQSNSEQVEAAIAGLNKVASDGDLPVIYRQIASFKALTLQGDSLSVNDRRQQFEALAQPGAPLRLLAEEQLALIDISEGDVAAGEERLQNILQDSEVTADLQQRASQLIVALGGKPEALPGQQG
ncbi:hypothetical protein DS909_09035 [Phaeobacter gallaeciensis]|uniref:Tetratricopeptide repeat-like domain-containing protein n=2 Tax=Roseobacteraceae TaxID=2854170 RepID=A0A366X1M3_9RHOB|nr:MULTISPECIES: hypothetical protein [Roseobacteraceae]MBT3139945.1 hypothetical protein [Falsiruegeria litorea]MBT8170251.1 hypothetical protein [Falsiruegeria litorea]RBW56837.1 hypothetical protein DS909_09035 [Phaeobacter gallaeciensis]